MYTLAPMVVALWLMFGLCPAQPPSRVGIPKGESPSAISKTARPPK